MKYPLADDQKFKKIVKDLATGKNDPFYLYDQTIIIRNIESISKYFTWQDQYINYFPVRENPNPVILSILWNAGSGILACGYTELLLCSRLGFSGKRLMYQPDVIDDRGSKLADDLDAAWLITAPSLLPACPCNTVILRYCPDKADKILTSKHTKSGLMKDELLELLRILKVRNVPQIGIEVQVKPFDYNPHSLSMKARTIFSMILEMKTVFDMDITVCNLGDSLRHSSENGPVDQMLINEIEKIRAVWDAMPEDCRPVVHTSFSRHITENAGLLVSRILDIRYLYEKQLVLNVSSAQYLRQALFRSRKEISLIPRSRKSSNTPQFYQLVGTIPEEFDRLMPEKVLLAPSVGDLIIFHDVGCGSRAMPLLYHFEPICAEFLVDLNGNVRKISSERTSEDVMEFIIGTNFDC